MKKLMNIFVLVAAAAMTLASCQKNEIDGPVNREVHFTIKADFAETKTAITDNGDKTYTPTWAKGDKIGVLFSLEESAEPVDFENTALAGEEATFEGTNTFVANDEGSVEGNLYAFYPSSAFNKMYDGGNVRLDLNATQYPTSTSFDPSCDFLIAKPCCYMAEATGEQVEVLIDEMYFARMMSVLRINLNSDFLSNETVKSVSFDADGIDFTGAMRFDLATGEFVGNQSAPQDLSEVKAVYSEEDPIAVAGATNSAYLVVAPVTIPSGTALTFTIETENYDIVKTISAPAKMEMPAGNVAVINLTIAEENCTAKAEDTSDYSGTYAILAKRSSGGYWYMTNDLGSASTKRFTAEDAGDALPEEGVELGASKLWEISKSGDYYTVKSVGTSQYITWTSGNSANLGDEGVQFTITQKDGLYNLKYTASDTDRYLSLNGSSGNDYFALYKSGQAMNLALIPAVQGEEPSTLTVTTPEQMSADGGDGSFTYTITNPKDGVTLIVSKNAEWITDVTVGETTVTYKVTANETEQEREALITLTYGELTETVTVSQAGKAATESAYYEKVTSAPTDWSGKYLLVCESKSMVLSAISTTSTKYGVGSEVSISDSKIKKTNNLEECEITIETSNPNVLAFKGSYLTWTSGNSLNVATAISNNTKWDITFSSGNATIQNAADNTRKIGWNASSPRFACYTSSQTAVQLYKLVGSDEGSDTPVEKSLTSISVSGYTTEFTAGNEFEFGGTVIATYSDGSTEDVTEFATYGGYNMDTAGTYTVTVSYEGKTATYQITVTDTTDDEDDDQTTDPITISVTISDIADANNWTNSTKYTSFTLNDVITATATGGDNTGKYYTSGENWRIYQNESPSLTISAAEGYTILTVKVTYSINNTGILTYNGSNITTETEVTVNASSISFGVGNTGSATNGQVRVTAIEVVYQAN